MREFEKRNENFQRFDVLGMEEERQRYMVQLRKAKRKDIIEKRRFCNFQKKESCNIAKTGSESVDGDTNLLVLLERAGNSNSEIALSALNCLLDYKFLPETFPPSIPVNISQALVKNLKSPSNIQEETLKLIEKIFSEISENLFHFEQTQLLSTIISTLPTANISTLNSMLNIIILSTYPNKIPPEQNKHILNHLHIVLNTHSLSTPQIKTQIVSLYQQLDFNSISKEFLIQITNHLTGFLTTDSSELSQISITVLKDLLDNREYLNSELISAFPKLLLILESIFPKQIYETLQILLLITAGTDSHTQLLLNFGILDRLVSVQQRFLYHGSNKIARLAAAIITNLLAGTEDQIIFTLSYKIPLINQLCMCQDDYIYNEAVFAVFNTINANSKVANLKLVKTGAILSLFSNLTVSRIMLGRSCTERLLKALKKISASLNDSDWRDLVKELQDKQIVEKIYAILEDKAVKNLKVFSELEKVCGVIQDDEIGVVGVDKPIVFEFS